MHSSRSGSKQQHQQAEQANTTTTTSTNVDDDNSESHRCESTGERLSTREKPVKRPPFQSLFSHRRTSWLPASGEEYFQFSRQKSVFYALICCLNKNSVFNFLWCFSLVFFVTLSLFRVWFRSGLFFFLLVSFSLNSWNRIPNFFFVFRFHFSFHF